MLKASLLIVLLANADASNEAEKATIVGLKMLLKAVQYKTMVAAWDKTFQASTVNTVVDITGSTSVAMKSCTGTNDASGTDAKIVGLLLWHSLGSCANNKNLLDLLIASDAQITASTHCDACTEFQDRDIAAALEPYWCVAPQAADGKSGHCLAAGSGSLSKAQWLTYGAPASAKGDPHVTNMAGEKFDVLKSGARTMVQYPRESSDPSFVVMAEIVRADAKWCENTFIENVQAQGSMLGTSVSFTMGKLRAPGPFKVTVGRKSMSLSEVILKKVSLPVPRSYISGEAKQMTLTLAEGVSIRVQLVKHSHFQFFNLDVNGLSNLPGEVGGLLGMDDHSGEAHEDCKFKTHKTALADDDGLSDLASLITAA